MDTGSDNQLPNASPPPLRRLRRPRWSDPRMVIGILLVAVPVIVGAQLFRSADDTTAVWALRENASRGAPLSVDQLHTVRVKLDDDVGERYVPASEQMPSEIVWAYDVSAGELLSRSAMRDAADVPSVEIPLPADATSAPADLAVGDLVDVWVTAEGSGASSEAELVLAGVDVGAVRTGDAGLGGQAAAQVVIRAPQDSADELAGAIAAISSGAVTLVRVEDAG